MKSIRKTLKLNALMRNDEQFYLHKSIIGYLTSLITPFTMLTALFADYKAKFEQEDILNKQVKKYLETEDINELTKTCVDFYLVILKTIKAGLRSYDADIKDAARHLDIYTRNYKHLSGKGHPQIIAGIYNLLQDLRLDVNKPYTATINIDGFITDMASHNEMLESLFNSRSRKIEEHDLLGRLRDARRDTDNALDALATSINSLYQINEIDTKDETRRKQLDTIIDGTNALINQAEKDYYAHVKTQRPNTKHDKTKPGEKLTPVFKVSDQVTFQEDPVLEGYVRYMSMKLGDPKRFSIVLEPDVKGATLHTNYRNKELQDFVVTDILMSEDKKPKAIGIIVEPAEQYEYLITPFGKYEACEASLIKDDKVLAELSDFFYPDYYMM